MGHWQFTVINILSATGLVWVLYHCFYPKKKEGMKEAREEAARISLNG